MTTRTVERSRELDINWCNREQILKPGASGTLSWTRDRDGEEISSIGYTYLYDEKTDSEALVLRYTVTHEYLDREPRELAYPVEIDRTPCNFGGTRPWFRCPTCTDRVAKLYRVPRYDKYICRDCGNLRYKSQTYRRPLVKAFERLYKTNERIQDGVPSQKDLQEFYRAKQSVFDAETDILDRIDDTNGDSQSRDRTEKERINDLPPFEKWVDDLFHKSFGSAGGRHYGFDGRCTATAKTTGERCRQPAIGEHGKCYYHGGAPGSGIGDDQTNHQIEYVQQLLEEVERKRELQVTETMAVLDTTESES